MQQDLNDILALSANALLEAKRTEFQRAKSFIPMFSQIGENVANQYIAPLPERSLFLSHDVAALSHEELSPHLPLFLRSVQPVGRADALGTLLDFAKNDSAHPVLELAGEEGTGKTLMLNTLFHALSAEKVVVFYPNFSSHSTLAALLLDFLGGNSAEESFVRHTASARLVMLLDNAEFLPEHDRAFLASLVFRAHNEGLNFRLIATHRTQLPQFAGRDRVYILTNLKSLHIPDALGEILGKYSFSDDEIRKIHQATGGQPLALEEFLRLKIAREELLQINGAWAFANPNFHSEAVSTLSLIAENIGYLPKNSAVLLSAFALARTPIPLTSLEIFSKELVENATESAAFALFILWCAGYIRFTDNAVTIAHTLFADATELLTDASILQKARRGLAHFALETKTIMNLHQAGILLYQAQEYASALPLLLGAMNDAESEERFSDAVLYAEMIVDSAQKLNQSEEVISALQTQIRAYYALNDHPNEEKALRLLITAAQEAHRNDIVADALLQEASLLMERQAYEKAGISAASARAIGEQIHEPQITIAARWLALQSAFHRKDWTTFFLEMQTLPDLLLEHNYRDKAALCLFDAGVALAKYLGETEKSLAYYSRAETLYSDINNPKGLARTLGNKGIALTELKRYDEALASFQSSISSFQALGDERGMLTALENIIQVHLAEHNLAEAEHTVKRAKNIAQTLGDAEEIGKIAKLLAHIQAKMNTETPKITESPRLSSEEELEEGILAGKSSSVKTLRTMIKIAAEHSVPVLLEGEFGAGKELLARKIHALSRRADMPFTIISTDEFSGKDIADALFIPINSQVLPDGLLAESRGGTLFINDICKTSAPFQAKLARMIAENKINIRIIAATSMSPEIAVKNASLLPALYYALHVIRIAVPSLSERREDIPVISELLVEKYSRRLGKPSVKIPSKLLRQLMQRDWNGNIQELDNTILRWIIFEGTEATPLPEKSTEISVITPTQQAEYLSVSEIETIDEAQKQHILRALEQCKGNKSKAADMLKIKRTTLLARMKKFGLMP